jgi:hypothetical protein
MKTSVYAVRNLRLELCEAKLEPRSYGEIIKLLTGRNK